MDLRAIALLVHSQPVPLEFLRTPLRELDISTASCKSCAQLEKTLKEIKPQLVFTDLKLEDCNWHDVLKIVRNAFPHTKVIVVGTKLDSRLDLTVRQSGGYGYVAPPFEPSPFHLFVRTALKDTEDQKAESAKQSPLPAPGPDSTTPTPGEQGVA